MNFAFSSVLILLLQYDVNPWVTFLVNQTPEYTRVFTILKDRILIGKVRALTHQELASTPLRQRDNVLELQLQAKIQKMFRARCPNGVATTNKTQCNNNVSA